MNKIDFLYIFKYPKEHIEDASKNLSASLNSLQNQKENINIIVCNHSQIDIRGELVGFEDIEYCHIPNEGIFSKGKFINYAVKHIIKTDYFFVSDIDMIYDDNYIQSVTDFISEKPIRIIPLGYKLSQRVDALDYNTLSESEHKGEKVIFNGMGLINRELFVSINGYNESFLNYKYASTELDLRLGKMCDVANHEVSKIISLYHESINDIKEDADANFFDVRVLELSNVKAKNYNIEVLKTNNNTWGSIGEIEDALWNMSPQERCVAQWNMNHGEDILRLEYNLTEDSIVFDVGAYIGAWSDKIMDKYNCNVFMFEPCREYYTSIFKKFCDPEKINVKQCIEEFLATYSGSETDYVYNFMLAISSFIFKKVYGDKVQLHRIGLDGESKQSNLFLNGDASTIFGEDMSHVETIDIVEFMRFVRNNDIKKIDLLKLNVEGAEYSILKNIIDNEYINSIDNIQIQFHSFVPDAENLRKGLHEELLKTHYLTYHYPWVWENWRKRGL
jgi:FkbM family methyltransferase